MNEDLFGPDAWGPLAKALVAFAAGMEDAVLTVHADEGEPDPLPISLFFRSPEDLRDADRAALGEVRGRILDAGAGVGSITLVLQDLGYSVMALEVIPEAVEIMRRRGVVNARAGRLEELPPLRAFDTVLMLMNGTALAGTLAGLGTLLRGVDGILRPGGQLILDSTDLLDADLVEASGGSWSVGDYPGELHFQLEFRGERGAPFPQLFVDPVTLSRAAREEGWRTEVVWQGDSGEYLARLTRSEERVSEDVTER